MSIPRETIDIIRDRAQIQEIIRKYVPTLQKKGKNYLGLCPFHKEKTPSFTVSAEKQIFYCFGCHSGGNVFTFISKIEKLNFPESVRFLGNLLGIQVQEDFKKQDSTEFDELKNLNYSAMMHYHKTLRSATGKPGIDYITKRGVLEPVIDEFHLGYAPESWSYLTDYLNAKHLNISQALKLGLVGSSDKNGSLRYYDRFRNRIIFPIFNQKNEIIAFGGRIISNGEPKYLNSPESPVFKKGDVLYGFNIAREHISSLNRAIVVEGYLDVIGCHQNGIKNVVAPLGTALTLNHVRLLSRHCSELILLFDADSAGIKASLRSLELLKDININVRVAVLPEDDPFDFINKKGIREFMAIVDSSVTPVDFRIQRVIAESAGKKTLDILLGLFDIIREIEYETERSRYLNKVSSLLKIGENEIRADFKKFLERKTVQGGSVLPIGEQLKKGKTSYQDRIYRELVALLCNYPELMEQAVLDFSEADISDPVARAVFKRIVELYSSDEKISIDRLFDYFSDGDEKEFLEENLDKDLKIERPSSAYTEIYIKLKLDLIYQKIEHYSKLITGLNSSDALIREYEIEIEILSRERDKLSSYIYNKQII